jgi:hypothetical protein
MFQEDVQFAKNAPLRRNQLYKIHVLNVHVDLMIENVAVVAQSVSLAHQVQHQLHVHSSAAFVDLSQDQMDVQDVCHVLLSLQYKALVHHVHVDHKQREEQVVQYAKHVQRKHQLQQVLYVLR